MKRAHAKYYLFVFHEKCKYFNKTKLDNAFGSFICLQIPGVFQIPGAFHPCGIILIASFTTIFASKFPKKYRKIDQTCTGPKPTSTSMLFEKRDFALQN